MCRSALASGDILEVDTFWGPQPPSLEGGFYAPISLVQNALAHLVGTGITSRLYVLGVVFLCAYGAMVALRELSWPARVAAAVVAVMNPWVYERLADGQWTVVGAAGALFLFYADWVRMLDRPGRREVALTAASAALTVAFSAQFIALVVVVSVVSAVARRAWRQRELRTAIVTTVMATAALLLYGVILFIVGTGDNSYARVRTFTSADFTFFAAATDPRYGLFINLLGLQGYWAERVGRFVLADAGTALWPISTVTLAAAAFAGAWLDRRRTWLLVAGMAGLLLSASTALPGGAQALDTLSQHIPLAGAWREPEKSSALWLVAEAVLAGTFVDQVGRRAKGWLRRTGAVAAAGAVVVATLLPAGLTATSQIPADLTPVGYPADWLAAGSFLAAHRDDVVMVLPWHLYEALPFAGDRVVHNPAEAIFPGRLLVSADPELSGEAALPSPGGVAGPASQPGPGCALASAVIDAGARWVVVEPVLEGPDDQAALVTCGFTVAEGGAHEVAVLEAPPH